MIELPTKIKGRIFEYIQIKYRSKKPRKSPYSTKGMGLVYYTIRGIDQKEIEREIREGRFKIKKFVIELDNQTTDEKSLIFHLDDFNRIYKDGYHSDEIIRFIEGD